MTEPEPTPPPSFGIGRTIAFSIASLVAGLVIGAVVTTAAGGGDREPAPVAAAAAAATTVYVTVTPDAPLATGAAVAPTTSAPPPPPPTTTIQEGTWTVGEDIPPGSYKVINAPETCYWGIYKSGQNQDLDAIISNHNGGGNLRVTLKAGQDFTTERCGTWTKVG